MPRIFPLTGLPKHFIPTAPNHFVEYIIEDIVDQVLFIKLEDPEASYPAVIEASSLLDQFEPEEALKMIDCFHKTRRKRKQINYFQEVYCRNKIRREFLKLKPSCFLILGIPSEKRYEIGEAFAAKMSHVHIDVQTLINQEMAKRTDVGKWVYTNLKMRKGIPIALVMCLLRRALKRPDVRYRGYVLTGFPIIPHKKFTKDRLPIPFDQLEYLEEPPIEKCQHFLKTMIRVIKYPGPIMDEEQVKIENFQDENDESPGDFSSNSSFFEETFEADHESDSSDSESSEFDPEHELCLHQIINDSRLQQTPEDDDFIRCVRNQFNTLLEFDLSPDIIIYFRHDEEESMTCSRSASNQPKINGEEAGVETILSEVDPDHMSFNQFQTGSASNTFDSTSESSFDSFDDFYEDPKAVYSEYVVPLYVKRFLSIKYEMQQFTLHYAKNMVIKIDNRLSSSEAIEQMEMRMKFINFKYVSEAIPIFPDGIPKNVAYELAKLKTKEEKLNLVCRTDTIIPNLTWRRTHMMLKCPVKLYQNKIVEGKILFAVRFMGNIHMLSSFATMKKFIRDPIKYAFSKPNCRVAFVGPRIPSIASVMKTTLGCSEYDWKEYLQRDTKYEDVYRQASDWAENFIENINLEAMTKNDVTSQIRWSNIYNTFRTITQKLLSILADDYSTEEDIVPSEVLSEIGIDPDDPNVMEILQSALNDKDRLSAIPDILRKSFRTSMPFQEISDILTDEKFNQIYKEKYHKDLSQNIAKWINTEDQNMRAQTKGNIKYGRWLIHDAPANIMFWKYLEKHNALPDVVVLIKDKSHVKLSDLYRRRIVRLKDVHHMATYIIQNFPLLFNESERLLKSLEATVDIPNETKKLLEELLDAIDLDFSSSQVHSSLEEVDEYLRSRNVITIFHIVNATDPLETTYTAVVQKYYQLFRTAPTALSSDDIKYLYRVNEECDKMTINIDPLRGARFYETFNLRLDHTKNISFLEYQPDSTQAPAMSREQFIDLAEISEQNIANIKRRFDLSHILFGNTRKYCPVVYLDHKSLYFGRPEYLVEYGNRFFMMSSYEAHQQFLRHPFKYVHDCLEPVAPPFRCCIAGPFVNNRSAIAAILAKQRGVKTACFSALLMEYIDKKGFMRKLINKSDNEIYEEYCDGFLRDHVGAYFKDGFIFEGFPTTPKQFHDMLRNHLYPEIIVVLDGRAQDILVNIFKEAKRSWEDKINWLILDNRRRAKLSEEFAEGEADATSDEKSFSFESSHQSENYEEVHSAFNEETFAVDRIPTATERYKFLTELADQCRNDLHSYIENIKAVAKTAIEFNIPVIEIPSMLNKTVNRCKRAISIVTQESNRRTMFDLVYVIPPALAEKMLHCGICLYSHFKNHDPVDAYNLIAANLHEAYRKRDQLYACVYRRLIYYLNGWNNLVAFYKNPKMYAKVENPFQLTVPMRMAVLGPPFAGSTTLCNRISHEFNMPVFTKRDLTKLIGDKYPCSYLVRSDPGTLPRSKVFLESMQIARNCSPNGFILDNYDINPQDLIDMAKQDIPLHLVMVMDSSFQTVWRNWKSQFIKQKRLTYTDIVQELRKLFGTFQRFKKKLHKFKNTIDIRFFNVTTIRRTQSKWNQWDEARSEIFLCLREVGGYYKNLTIGKCFSLSHINVFWIEFKQRLSPLKLFCPVCLRLQRRLTQYRYDYIDVGLSFYNRKCQREFNEPFGYNMDSLYQTYDFPKWYEWSADKKPILSGNMFRENLVQYREHFYWSCDRHRLDLTLNTEVYLPPDPIYLPLFVPFLVKNYFRINLEHDGRCVVSYSIDRSIVHGSYDYSVYYRGKVFLCADEACAFLFLQYPEKYYGHGPFIPDKTVVDWDTKDLEIDYGTLTPEILIRILLSLADERPKHFAWDIANSAAIYLGLQLKSLNPNNTSDVTKFYERLLSNYTSECSMLRAKIAKIQHEGNPFIRRRKTAIQASHV